MDAHALERAGILLTFLAGFFVAPELIGHGRLQHLQARVAGRLQASTESLRLRTRQAGPQDLITWVMISVLAIMAVRTAGSWVRVGILVLGPLVLGVLLLAITIVVAPALMLPIALALVVLFVLAGTAFRLLELRNGQELTPRSPRQLAKAFALAPIAGSAALVGLLVVALGLVPIVFFGALAQGMAVLTKAMEGEGRLASYLVPLGVVCFIVGNLFQFIATFAKP